MILIVKLVASLERERCWRLFKEARVNMSPGWVALNAASTPPERCFPLIQKMTVTGTPSVQR